ncbi:MAG: CHAT domain-containing protein [Cyanobacteria bacterium P01_F01_bin.150]
MDNVYSKTINAQSSSLAQAELGTDLLSEGLEHYAVEQYRLAIEQWSQAVEYFSSPEDWLNQALTHSYLSLAYQQLGQWDEANGAIATSLEKLQDHSEQNLSVQALDVQARVLNAQGRLQWSQGEFQLSLETWRKAEAIYEQVRDLEGVILSSINQSQALQGLGLSTQAKATLDQLTQRLDPKTVSKRLQVIGWWNLGKAERRLGNFEAALERLNQGVAIARDADLATLSNSILLDLGNTERDRGDRAIGISQPDVARGHYSKAIDYYQQIASDNDIYFQASVNTFNVLVNTVALNTGAIDQVAALWPKLIENGASGLNRTQVFTLLNFAQSLICLKQYQVPNTPFCPQESKLIQAEGQQKKVNDLNVPTWTDIHQLLANALNDARQLQDPKAESYVLGQLGMLYELAEQYADAELFTRQALFTIAELQVPDIRYRWEWQLGRLRNKQKDSEGAIAAYRTAFETLKNVRNDLLTVDSDVQFSFRDNVEPVYRTLVDLLLRTEDSSIPSSKRLTQAVETADSLQLAELENFLRCNFAQTSEFVQQQTSAASADRINQLDADAALIYPVILDNRLEVIVKLPNEPLHHYASDVAKGQVEQTVQEVRTALIGRTRPSSILLPKAADLYDWIIRPLEAKLTQHKEVKTLVFVLDGTLQNIPMSVLYDSHREQYLLEKPYAITLLPSLQLFDLRTPRPEQMHVLAAGVSEERTIGNQRFSKLENVMTELDGISEVVQTEILLNQAFQEEKFVEKINSERFTAVHVATHGQFSSDPKQSFIMAYEKLLKSEKLDNLLRTDTQDRSDIIDLFVLSACETAKGDDRATLGLAGIAVRAGALTTVSTLWQVNDQTTAIAMKEFYRLLIFSDMSKAEALHQTQLSLYNRYKHRSPFIWAPYVLIGNWL